MTVGGTVRSRRPRLGAGAAFLLASLALGAIGCSGSGSSADASPVATTAVDLPKSYRFEPAAITVAAGSTVTWTNNDNFSHNVAFEGSEPQPMKPGESTDRTFDTPGTFPYECSLHPQDMQGTVVVTGG